MHQPPLVPETMKRIRAFISLTLPDTISASIRHVQEQLAGHRLKVRWIRAENIHLTLKFLGEIDATRIDAIDAAVAEAAAEKAPFHLSAKGVGVFPNIKRARVIWIGVAGQVNALTELQHNMASRLDTIGFPRDRRRYSGHLTIGRSKGAIDAGSLMNAMAEIRSFESEPFIVNRVSIFRSELHSTGAVYTELRTVPLMPHLA